MFTKFTLLAISLFRLLLWQFPDGENYRDVFARLESLLLEMVAEPQPVVVVAHLAVLRVIYGWVYFLSLLVAIVAIAVVAVYNSCCTCCRCCRVFFSREN